MDSHTGDCDVRPKLSCASCERIVRIPAPSRPIERGLAGPGLLAHVLVAKYCDHQLVSVLLCRPYGAWTPH